MSAFADRFLQCLNNVAGSRAPLHVPEIAGNEWSYVKECLDTGWISTAGGKYIDQFESGLAEATGTPFVITTMTGSAALHACLHLAGVCPGDEVICPAFTFAATANAISHMGAIPHFADIDYATLGLSPNRLAEYLDQIAVRREGEIFNRETNSRISAVVCMHTFGHVCDVEGLSTVCEEWNVDLIEDAAESLGSTLNDRHAGTFSRFSALSFNGNKIVSTGGGGAIFAGDSAAAERARHLTSTAKRPHRWEYDHDVIGFNYRMPNINAALGAAQLERLPQFVSEKRRLQTLYQDAFSDLNGIEIFEEAPGRQSNYWLITAILTPECSAQRDHLLELTNDAGLATRPAWRPLHLSAPYHEAPRMELPVTEDLYGRVLNVPSSPVLGREGVSP